MARKPTTIKAAPADLSELDADLKVHEDGVELPILQIDGVSPIGFGILVAGPESERNSIARDRMARDMAYLAATKGDTMTDAERRQIETAFLSRICIAFTAPAKLDGALLENTEEDFTKLFRRFPYIRRQVDFFQGNRANFTNASPSASSSSSEASSKESEQSQPQSSSESGQSSGE